MSLTINYSNYKNLTIGQLNGKVYLSINENNVTKFVFLPSFVNYTFQANSISFTPLCQDAIKPLDEFLKTLDSLQSIKEESNFKKKLRLKGLGFRISVDMIKRELSLKLGYSHLVNVEIPYYITNIKAKKNIMLLESFDKMALGDFLKKVYDLRKADSYKGKGFSGQYEKRKLKVIKKK
jgi:hypothetical protein